MNYEQNRSSSVTPQQLTCRPSFVETEREMLLSNDCKSLCSLLRVDFRLSHSGISRRSFGLLLQHW